MRPDKAIGKSVGILQQTTVQLSNKTLLGTVFELLISEQVSRFLRSTALSPALILCSSEMTAQFIL